VIGSVVLPDTHTLYWHIARSDRLSPPAREVFARAAAGQCVLALSPIVLAELYWILRKQGAATAFRGGCAAASGQPGVRLRASDLRGSRHIAGMGGDPRDA
jgi:hypothetical protein